MPLPISRRLRYPAVRVLLATLLAATLASGARAACTGPQPLEARLKAHPDAQTWAELGNWFGEHKQFACAEQAFRTGLRLDPKSAHLNYLLGLSLYEARNFAAAVPPLQQAIRTDGNVLKPHLVLASALAHLGQPIDAELEWRAALHIDPKADMALHGLSQSLLAQGNFPAEISLLHGAKLDSPLAIDLAIAYTRNGQTEEAIRTITDALKADPSSVPLSSALVTLYVRVSRTDEAEHVAESCYRQHPEDLGAEISYMRTLVLNGDWAPARPLGGKLMTQAPHAFETLYLNGVLERQDGDYTAARDHLTEASGMNPDLANLQYNLGAALARLHDNAGAKDHLQKALSLGDQDPEVHFELANALRGLGDSDGARQEMVLYQQAVTDKQNATVATSKSAEAVQSLEKGDTAHAIQLYRDALAATPKDAMIAFRLSEAQDKAGDTDGERATLEQVVALDPEFALAQNQLGYLDSRRGDNAGAEQHFRQAVHAAPGFAQAWISLAATLGMESKFSEAQQAVNNALRLDPDNPEAHQLSHELAAAAQSPPRNQN